MQAAGACPVKFYSKSDGPVLAPRMANPIPPRLLAGSSTSLEAGKKPGLKIRGFFGLRVKPQERRDFRHRSVAPICFRIVLAMRDGLRRLAPPVWIAVSFGSV